MRARYYDPTIGRFINEDSYPGEDKDPLSLNLYTYPHNNPVLYFDPSGHSAKAWMEKTNKVFLTAGASVMIYVQYQIERTKEFVYSTSQEVVNVAENIASLAMEAMYDDQKDSNNQNDGEEAGGKSSDNHYNWGDPSTLQDHTKRHGPQFGSTDEDDYAKKANDFYNDRSNHQVKVDEDGVTRVYDPDTNTFGSYNPDGTTKTFFKPRKKQGYFDDQPGQ